MGSCIANEKQNIVSHPKKKEVEQIVKNERYLVTLGDIDDLLPGARIDCWKCLATGRIDPFVVDEQLENREARIEMQTSW